LSDLTIAPLGPLVVLLVEDDELLRSEVAAFLTDEGYRVIQSSNADDAVDLLKGGLLANIVLTDIHMPGSIDGFGLARHVLQTCPGTRVILTSGRDYNVPAWPHLTAVGPIIPKPYDPEVLLANLKGNSQSFRKME
jgi:DNA-binding response OmpR family regulator